MQKLASSALLTVLLAGTYCGDSAAHILIHFRAGCSVLQIQGNSQDKTFSEVIRAAAELGYKAKYRRSDSIVFGTDRSERTLVFAVQEKEVFEVSAYTTRKEDVSITSHDLDSFTNELLHRHLSATVSVVSKQCRAHQ